MSEFLVNLVRSVLQQLVLVCDDGEVVPLAPLDLDLARDVIYLKLVEVTIEAHPAGQLFELQVTGLEFDVRVDLKIKKREI